MTYPIDAVGGRTAPSPQTQQTQPIRTPTGLPYGEAGALQEAQRAAPLPEAGPQAAPAPPKLSEPTTNPGQPVTAGAALGLGPGPEALGPQAVGMPAGGRVSQTLARVAAVDNSGVFARMLTIAQQKGL